MHDLQGYVLNPFAFPMALAAFALVVLGIATLHHDRHSRHSRIFFWFSLALADYFACFTMVYLSSDAHTALLWVRLAYIGVPLIPVMLLAFVTSLDESRPLTQYLVAVGWFVAAAFIIAALTTDWLIAGVYRPWWGYYNRYGALGAPFLAYNIVYGAFCGVLYQRLLRAARPGSRGQARLRIHVRSLLVGSLIGVDYIAVYGWPLYPVGYLPALALVVMLLFAMRRYGPVLFSPELASEAILKAMGEALFALDEDGIVRKCNHAAELLLRGSSRDLVGHTLESLLSIDPAQSVMPRLFTQPASSPIEINFTDKAGNLRILNVNPTCLNNRLGQPVATLCIVHDVTQEREAQIALRQAHAKLEQKVAERTHELEKELAARTSTEAALRTSERRYRDLFDSISDFICTHDLEGRLITINQTACKAANLKVEQLIGHDIREFLPPQFGEAFERDYLSAIKSKGYVQGISKFLGLDGQIRYLEYRNRLVKEEGSDEFVIGSARDVTERIQSEREMRKLEDQLRQAQKIEAIGTLAGGIAHDFNNALQAISGYNQLLLRDLTSNPLAQERLRSIDRTVERASAMIKQLMTLARKAETRRESVDLNFEISQTIKVLEHTLPKMITIRSHLDPKLKSVIGDPGQFEQVFLNLATNASYAMPQGGELSFRTRQINLTEDGCKDFPGIQPGEYASLEIADTGIGMDENIRSKIFDPFFTTKPSGDGTGLGLSTVYGIVINHGGQIYCQSKPKQGTTFSIFIPVDQEQKHMPSKESGEPFLDPTGSENLLLVDDEDGVLSSSKEALESFGYHVTTADSGESALQIFLQNPEAVDLVLMDLNMPGMGGLASMKGMLKAWPAAKIIAVSGYADVGMEDSILEIGGAGLMIKPYRFTNLLAMVRRVLDTNQSHSF